MPGESSGTGVDEAQDLHSPASPIPARPRTTKDRVYISHAPAPAGATAGEFDDLVLWISPAPGAAYAAQPPAQGNLFGKSPVLNFVS